MTRVFAEVRAAPFFHSAMNSQFGSSFETSSEMQGLTVNLGSNSLANLGVKLNAQGSAADLKKFDLRSYRADVSQQNQPMLTVSGGL